MLLLQYIIFFLYICNISYESILCINTLYFVYVTGKLKAA